LRDVNQYTGLLPGRAEFPLIEVNLQHALSLPRSGDSKSQSFAVHKSPESRRTNPPALGGITIITFVLIAKPAWLLAWRVQRSGCFLWNKDCCLHTM
jgi:hypothetical protein